MKKVPVYNRVLLKLSGEALMGESQFGIDSKVLDRISNEVVEVIQSGVQIALVIGGGNLFRGATLQAAGLDRITGDYMGMLATIMNALAMRDALEYLNMTTRIMSAIPVSGVVDPYDRRKAIYHLERDRVVIFAGGTGNPLVTTDSAASLRAIEVKSDVLLKATQVDGVYSSDPAKDPQAMRYERIRYDEVLKKELGVMDLAAFCQCRDHHLPLIVFDLHKPGALLRVINGENEGTLVSNGIHNEDNHNGTSNS